MGVLDLHSIDRKKSDDAIRKEVARQFLDVEKKLRISFSKIKDEFEDHLDAINQNTEEVSKFYDCIGEIDEKLDKINARIDTIHMMFRRVINHNTISVDLNLDEQRAFVLLNACPKYLSIEDLAYRVGLEEDQAYEVITAMTDKGIPMDRKRAEGKPCIKLDDEFKRLQARDKMIRISPAIMQQFENKVLNNFFG